MDFRNFVPPELELLLGIGTIAACAAIVFGFYWLAQHVTIGWL